CGLQEGQAAGPAATGGAIAGPSSVLAAAPAAAAAPGGRAGQPPTAEQQAERDNLPGFKKTPVEVMLARAGLDPNGAGANFPADNAHPEADGRGHGPKAEERRGPRPSAPVPKRRGPLGGVFLIRPPRHDRPGSDSRGVQAGQLAPGGPPFP